MRILYVCMGNICRSPSAENVMRHLVEKEGLSDVIKVDSAGTIDFHRGKRPDPRSIAAAEARGITMKGHSRQITTEDLSAFDWIFVMDDDNHHYVTELARTADMETTANIAYFCEFCTRHDARFVPDPYTGGLEGFERVLDLLEDGCAGFLASPHVQSLRKPVDS